MTREEKQKAIDALKISAPVMAVTQEEFKNYIQTLNQVMDWLEQEPILDELRAEVTTLQNRCYALTKGTMCAFCKYECEYKSESEDKN